jgi:membrane-bound metal-dependent hydrolase YbcI (DUF457 family)
MDPIAHASVGLMAKAAFPKAPLFALLIATEVPDLLFFAFQAAGIERQAVTQMDFRKGLTYLSPASIPWSHGLFMCIVWSMVAGGIAFLLYRRRQTYFLIGLMVFSHWILDFLAYNNLPLILNGSPLIGVGLVTSGIGVVIGIIVEVGLIAGGIAAFWVSRKRLAKPKLG